MADPKTTKRPARPALRAAATAPAKATRRTSDPRRHPAEEAARIRAIFTRLHAIEPEPKGELEHVNAFTLLVAVVLSAQATDAGVNKATRRLFALADNPQAMLALGEEGVREHIKTIGLFRTKAKNVIALCEKLIAEHGGVVPADREALETLPGVGRKTANVVLNMAFGASTLAVDTHVFRVAHRLGLAEGKTPLAVELGLMQVVPEDFRLHAHHWLILHGRYICKARRPECGRCPVNDLCFAREKTIDLPPPVPPLAAGAAPA